MREGRLHGSRNSRLLVRGNMSFNLLALIVALNVMATIALWRTAARRPGKLKKQFITTLLHSEEPIEPKHRLPKPLVEGWGITKRVQQFFVDFKDFADVVNWWFSEVKTGWRLQELSDPELKIGHHESPAYGRRYDVYYNQVRIGTLEVFPFLKGSVIARMRIEWVRLLPFSTMRDLLDGLALHVCDPYPASEEYRNGRAAIDYSLKNVMWTGQRITESDFQDYGNLDLRLDGSAMWYFDRRGTPGFAEWKSSRPWAH